MKCVWFNFCHRNFTYFELFEKLKIPDDRSVRNKYYKAFYNLINRGFFETIKRGHKKEFTLTKKGKIRILKYKIGLKSQKWDRKWRIIAFDIPEKYKKLRDKLRRYLKERGYIRFQKSVWIFPHGIEDELEEMFKELRVRQWINYLIVDNIDCDAELRQKFIEIEKNIMKEDF